MTAQIPFTQAGYDDLLKQKNKYLAERPEVVENLQKAREMGDLSENGYYKESKARLSFLDSRVRYLERLIKSAEIVKSSGHDTVQIGNQVTLNDGNKSYQYSIVGGYESDPAKNMISPLSPLGKAIIGKKTNELVKFTTPNGPVEYKILKIF